MLYIVISELEKWKRRIRKLKKLKLTKTIDLCGKIFISAAISGFYALIIVCAFSGAAISFNLLFIYFEQQGLDTTNLTSVATGIKWVTRGIIMLISVGILIIAANHYFDFEEEEE